VVLPDEPPAARVVVNAVNLTLAALIQLLFTNGRALSPLNESATMILANSNMVIALSAMFMLAVLAQRKSVIQGRLAQGLFHHARQLAGTDQLTGLPNRRPMVDYLEDAAADFDTEFVIALADLDEFKVFNDTYGHQCG